MRKKKWAFGFGEEKKQRRLTLQNCVRNGTRTVKVKKKHAVLDLMCKSKQCGQRTVDGAVFAERHLTRNILRTLEAMMIVTVSRHK